MQATFQHLVTWLDGGGALITASVVLSLAWLWTLWSYAALGRHRAPEHWYSAIPPEDPHDLAALQRDFAHERPEATADRRRSTADGRPAADRRP